MAPKTLTELEKAARRDLVMRSWNDEERRARLQRRAERFVKDADRLLTLHQVLSYESLFRPSEWGGKARPSDSFGDSWRWGAKTDLVSHMPLSDDTGASLIMMRQIKIARMYGTLLQIRARYATEVAIPGSQALHQEGDALKWCILAYNAEKRGFDSPLFKAIRATSLYTQCFFPASAKTNTGDTHKFKALVTLATFEQGRKDLAAVLPQHNLCDAMLEIVYSSDIQSQLEKIAEKWLQRTGLNADWKEKDEENLKKAIKELLLSLHIAEPTDKQIQAVIDFLAPRDIARRKPFQQAVDIQAYLSQHILQVLNYDVIAHYADYLDSEEVSEAREEHDDFTEPQHVSENDLRELFELAGNQQASAYDYPVIDARDVLLLKGFLELGPKGDAGEAKQYLQKLCRILKLLDYDVSQLTADIQNNGNPLSLNDAQTIYAEYFHERFRKELHSEVLAHQQYFIRRYEYEASVAICKTMKQVQGFAERLAAGGWGLECTSKILAGTEELWVEAARKFHQFAAVRRPYSPLIREAHDTFAAYEAAEEAVAVLLDESAPRQQKKAHVSAMQERLRQGQDIRRAVKWQRSPSSAPASRLYPLQQKSEDISVARRARDSKETQTEVRVQTDHATGVIKVNANKRALSPTHFYNQIRSICAANYTVKDVPSSTPKIKRCDITVGNPGTDNTFIIRLSIAENAKGRQCLSFSYFDEDGETLAADDSRVIEYTERMKELCVIISGQSADSVHAAVPSEETAEDVQGMLEQWDRESRRSDATKAACERYELRVKESLRHSPSMGL